MSFSVLPLNAWIRRIKAYTLAGYDCPKSDGLAKECKLQGKMQKRQIDTVPVHQHVFPSSTDNYSHIIGVCKLFSCNAKQHMPFWLLKDA